MKLCILVLVLAVSMVSCQQAAPAEEKKVNTKEMWAKIKNLFQTLKGKLTNPENVGEAQGETKSQLEDAASTFNDAMIGIGNNIYTFSAKVNSQADGKIVQSELAQLGLCGQEVLSKAALPLSEVVGIVAKKSIDAAKTVTLPDAPPKDIVKGIEKAAEDAKKMAEDAKEAASKAAKAAQTAPKAA